MKKITIVIILGLAALAFLIAYIMPYSSSVTKYFKKASFEGKVIFKFVDPEKTEPHIYYIYAGKRVVPMPGNRIDDKDFVIIVLSKTGETKQFEITHKKWERVKIGDNFKSK